MVVILLKTVQLLVITLIFSMVSQRIFVIQKNLKEQKEIQSFIINDGYGLNTMKKSK